MAKWALGIKVIVQSVAVDFCPEILQVTHPDGRLGIYPGFYKEF
jgi:hypothetical protein